MVEAGAEQCRLRAAEAGILCTLKASEVTEILSELLAAGYVQTAVHMPPASATIWGMMAHDMRLASQQKRFPQSVEADLVPYLRKFFADKVVAVVLEHLKDTKDSFLGGDYALKAGMHALALTILNDIVEAYVLQGSLKNFYGMLAPDGAPNKDDEDNDRQKVKGRSRRRGDGGRGAVGQGGAGRGGGRGGGGRPTFSPSTKRLPFCNMEFVDVEVPAFDTPEKGTDVASSSARTRTLRERSAIFKSRVPQLEKPYDPVDPVARKVHLYHGTRTFSLPRFQKQGIKPRDVPNEFSSTAAFYVSNSVQAAYEHPLHVHPGAIAHQDPVSVLVFEVDSDMLHGAKPLPSGRTMKVLWLQADEMDDYEYWLKFCKGNLDGEEMLEVEYDVIIGPACIPAPRGGGLPKKLDMDVGRGVKLIQIACCTRLAMDWIGSCVVKVLCEKHHTALQEKWEIP